MRINPPIDGLVPTSSVRIYIKWLCLFVCCKVITLWITLNRNNIESICLTNQLYDRTQHLGHRQVGLSEDGIGDRTKRNRTILNLSFGTIYFSDLFSRNRTHRPTNNKITTKAPANIQQTIFLYLFINLYRSKQLCHGNFLLV